MGIDIPTKSFTQRIWLLQLDADSQSGKMVTEFLRHLPNLLSVTLTPVNLKGFRMLIDTVQMLKTLSLRFWRKVLWIVTETTGLTNATNGNPSTQLSSPAMPIQVTYTPTDSLEYYKITYTHRK